MKSYKSIIVVCEGKSESCYISALGKLFCNVIALSCKNANGIENINNVFKKTYKDNRHSNIVIWCDEDVFKRGKPKTKLFEMALTNKFNFEDFLVMHLDKSVVLKWQDICGKNGHFEKPLTSEELEELITQIIPNYKKGYIPAEIELNYEALNRLFSNNKDPEIKFRSDFADFIEKELNSI